MPSKASEPFLSKPTRSYDRFDEEEQKQQTQIGGIVVTKVVHEHVPVTIGNAGSSTVGELIDRQLTTIAKQGGTVQKIEFHVNEEFWNNELGRVYADRHDSAD